MTRSHALKKDTRYRYYVSRSLITKDRAETSAGLRIPSGEIEHLVSSRVHRWLLDPGSIYKSTSARLTDASMQQRLVARAADLGKHWPELPVAKVGLSLDLVVRKRRMPKSGSSASGKGGCGGSTERGLSYVVPSNKSPSFT